MLSYLILFWIIFITGFFAIIVVLILSVCSLLKKECLFVHKLVWVWGRLVLLFHKIEVQGRQHIKKDQPQIIFANHQSNFDIFLVSAVLDIPFSWMAKDSLFRIPVFGWILLKLGYICVVRDNGIKASRSLIKAVKKLKEKVTVVIFPEGTWNDSSEKLLPFKEGLYFLAKKSQVSLLPIRITGTNHMNPPDTLKMRLGKIKLVIYPAIVPKDYNHKAKEEFLTDMKSVLENIPMVFLF